MIVATIANGGQVMAPYLMKEIQSQDLQPVETTQPDRLGTAISSDVAQRITALMVNNENSYAGNGKITGVQIAAKTGTAEHGDDPKNIAPHVWYVAFAPAQQPAGRRGRARGGRRRPEQPGGHRRVRRGPDRARGHRRRPRQGVAMMNVLAAGQHIADRYQLDRRIAVGGMGEVWEASDTRLGRSVAVKVLRPELTDDPEFLHRFRIEARTVASLDHAGIAGVHDYGEDEGAGGRRTAWLVMELVRGEPLSTLIARGPIDTDETLRIVEEAAWALQAAHERGFVHRDVKPGNILVRNDGMVKLTDFGIAKAADAVPVTRSGMVMGTAHYIAPEQASGAEAGPAGDVYSLGIVGYECLAGHRPFRADSAVAVAMMQVRDQPPPLPESVPPHARELIEAVLVKDPTQRYATGGEFAAAVAAVRRGEPLPPPGSLTGPFTPTRARAVITPGATPVVSATPATAPKGEHVPQSAPSSALSPRCRRRCRRRCPRHISGSRSRPGARRARPPPCQGADWSCGGNRTRPHPDAHPVRAADGGRGRRRGVRHPQPGCGGDTPGDGAGYRERANGRLADRPRRRPVNNDFGTMSDFLPDPLSGAVGGRTPGLRSPSVSSPGQASGAVGGRTPGLRSPSVSSPGQASGPVGGRAFEAPGTRALARPALISESSDLRNRLR